MASLDRTPIVNDQFIGESYLEDCDDTYYRIITSNPKCTYCGKNKDHLFKNSFGDIYCECTDVVKFAKEDKDTKKYGETSICGGCGELGKNHWGTSRYGIPRFSCTGTRYPLYNTESKCPECGEVGAAHLYIIRHLGKWRYTCSGKKWGGCGKTGNHWQESKSGAGGHYKCSDKTSSHTGSSKCGGCGKSGDHWHESGSGMGGYYTCSGKTKYDTWEKCGGCGESGDHWYESGSGMGGYYKCSGKSSSSYDTSSKCSNCGKSGDHWYESGSGMGYYQC